MQNIIVQGVFMEIKKVANKDFIYKVQEKETIKDICLKFKILENNLVILNRMLIKKYGK